MRYTGLLVVLLFGTSLRMFAQEGAQCPPNIGFENGTFSNWKCYQGNISATQRGVPQIPTLSLSETSPVYNQHTLIGKSEERDKYGDFSLNSPNGSEYIVKLGNDQGGRGAERIAYTLDVPKDVDAYSIIFNYAVVLQNPGHTPDEQPKFSVEIIDESTGSATSCGSFKFAASGGLPGFEVSTENTSVVFKRWSPVLLNLTEYRGRQIRIEFTTNDCTYNQHFGYVYLDFTENCFSPISGNVACAGSGPITLRSFPGLDQYRWFNVETGIELGTEEKLELPGDTPTGTKIGVELIPYPGLGCIQTLYTTIDGPRVKINQPPPACQFTDLTSYAITAGNTDLTYTYWLDAAATQLIPDPRKVSKTGTYYIKGTTSNGCSALGAVQVTIVDPPVLTVSNPLPVDYPATVDITSTYIPLRGINYSYWRDSKASQPLLNPEAVNRDATFYIRAENTTGCFTIAPVDVDIIYTGIVIPNTFTPNGDGVNDVLTVLIDNSYRIKNFNIFNAWGQIVYTTRDIYAYWDGNRRGSPAPDGVYYWFCDAVNKEGEEFRKSGSVTILR